MAFLTYEYNNCIDLIWFSPVLNNNLTQKSYYNKCAYMACLTYEYNNCIDMVLFSPVWNIKLTVIKINALLWLLSSVEY